MSFMKDISSIKRDMRRARSGEFFRIKSMFFDRTAVKHMLDRTSHRVLNWFGGKCMRIARNSIKSTDNISSPGSPPSSHVGAENKRIQAARKKAGLAPAKLSRGIKEIYYSYDPSRLSVVIGPIAFNSSELAGSHGRRGENITTLQLLEYGGTAYRRVRPIELGGETYWVRHPAFPPIRCTYRARPFMGPAFDKAEEELPAMWAAARAGLGNPSRK